MSRRQLFDVWRNAAKPERIKEMVSTVLSVYDLEDSNEAVLKDLKNFVPKISLKFNEKWLQSGRRQSTFLSKNKNCLDGDIVLPVKLHIVIKVMETEDLQQPSTSRGRPTKCFQEASERSKKRKVRNVVHEQSPSEILLAAEMSLRSSGKKDAASL